MTTITLTHVNNYVFVYMCMKRERERERERECQSHPDNEVVSGSDLWSFRSHMANRFDWFAHKLQPLITKYRCVVQ